MVSQNSNNENGKNSSKENSKFVPITRFDQRCLFLLSAINDRHDAQTVQDALVLSVILFWQGVEKNEGHVARIRATHERKGYLWTVFQNNEWLKRHGITERQARHSLKRLKEVEFIYTEIGYAPFYNKERAVFIRLNEQGIRTAIDQYHDKVKDHYKTLMNKQEQKYSAERQHELDAIMATHDQVMTALLDLRKELDERESLLAQMSLKMT